MFASAVLQSIIYQMLLFILYPLINFFMSNLSESYNIIKPTRKKFICFKYS